MVCGKILGSASGASVGAVFVAAPLLIGLLSARISGNQMKSFGELNQPPLSPPAWLFPVVWSILYIMMGITLLIIVKSESEAKYTALALFIVQLALNFVWSPVFFGGKAYGKALLILVAMLITTIVLTVITWKINRIASIMLMPYILWMSFATYLNAGVGVLNR